MTREEKRRIIEDAQIRALEALDKTPGERMGSEEFIRLLDAVWRMNWMFEPDPEVTSDNDFVPAPVQETPASEKTVSEEVQPEPVVESPSADREETIKYDKPTVRAALQGLRQKGINANSIIQKLGYENFPAVPETKYAELMAAIEEAS